MIAVVWFAAPGSEAEEPTGQVLDGAAIYRRCGACHSLTYDRVGPRHCGLLGRAAGSVPGFRYSEALKKSGIIWDRTTLDHFLRNPSAYVAGTTMTYAGIPSELERRILIEWLAGSTVSSECGDVEAEPSSEP